MRDALVINAVLETTAAEPPERYRLLYRCSRSKAWAWIRLPADPEEAPEEPGRGRGKGRGGRETAPAWVSESWLVAELRAGRLARAPDDRLAPSEVLAAASPKAQKRARRWWHCLGPLVEDGGRTLFDPESRQEALRKRAETTGVSVKQLRRVLYRYWQGGQVPATLVPGFARRGGRGKERTAGEAKRGAPDQGGGTAINLTPEAKERIEKGVRRFHLQEGQSLRKAWTSTVLEHFGDGKTTKLGRTIERSPHPDTVPSYHQFRYVADQLKEREWVRSIRAREGVEAYHQRHRPAVLRAHAREHGPGILAEVDATPLDRTLVSARFPDLLVGRPTIYILQDVFSTAVLGVHALLQAPSWEGMMGVLKTSFEPKVAFSARYGLEISEEEWPLHHVPRALLGDRGELLARHASHMAWELGLRVENAGSHRPDWKGHVERMLREFQEGPLRNVPAPLNRLGRKHRKHPERDAVITLDDLMAILICAALRHNQTTLLDDDDQIPPGYPVHRLGPPTPLEAWRWGVTERSGFLQTVSRARLEAALLPRGEAVIHDRHLAFQGLRYAPRGMLRRGSPPEASAFGAWWTRNLRRRGQAPRSVVVSYDPRNAGTLRVHTDSEEGPHAFELVAGDREYMGLSFAEAAAVQEAWEEAKQARKKEALARAWDHEQVIGALLKEAKARRAGRAAPGKDGGHARRLEAHRRGFEEAWTGPGRDPSPESSPELPASPDRSSNGRRPDYLADIAESRDRES